MNVQKSSTLSSVDLAPPPERLTHRAIRAAKRADVALELAASEVGKAIAARQEAAEMIRRAGVPIGHEHVVSELADGAAVTKAAVGYLAQLLGCPEESKSRGGPALERVLTPSVAGVHDAA